MNAKKLLLLVGVVFIGFWLLKDPQGLAEVAGAGGGVAWEFTAGLFDAAITFVNEIL